MKVYLVDCIKEVLLCHSLPARPDGKHARLRAHTPDVCPCGVWAQPAQAQRTSRQAYSGERTEQLQNARNLRVGSQEECGQCIAISKIMQCILSGIRMHRNQISHAHKTDERFHSLSDRRSHAQKRSMFDFVSSLFPALHGRARLTAAINCSSDWLRTARGARSECRARSSWCGCGFERSGCAIPGRAAQTRPCGPAVQAAAALGPACLACWSPSAPAIHPASAQPSRITHYCSCAGKSLNCCTTLHLQGSPSSVRRSLSLHVCR